MDPGPLLVTRIFAAHDRNAGGQVILESSRLSWKQTCSNVFQCQEMLNKLL